MIWIRINDMRFREKDRHLQNDPKRTLSFAHSLLDEERRGKMDFETRTQWNC